MPRSTSRSPARRRAASATSLYEVARSVIDGVRRLDRGLRLAARRVERKTGLSAAQLFVLHQLDEAPATALNDLAIRTYTDRSSVSGVVDRLEQAGLVTRQTSVRDRRQSEIRITARGKRKLAAAPAAPTDLLIEGIRALPRSTATRLGAGLAELNAVLGFEEAALLFTGE
jgi:DNA-binding MarR family transcriptional regulator